MKKGEKGSNLQRAKWRRMRRQRLWQMGSKGLRGSLSAWKWLWPQGRPPLRTNLIPFLVGMPCCSVRLYQPSREALFLEVSLEGRPELCFRRKKHCINCKPQLSNPIEYHRSHLTPTSDSSYINLTPTQPQLRGQKVDPPKHPESAKPKTDSLGKFPDLPTWKIISPQKIKGFTASGNRNREKIWKGKNANGNWWKESPWELMSY